MLRSEAARYARWSASLALLLAGVTVSVYLQRGWAQHLEKKHAPPPAPVEVSRRSNGITFKKQEQNRTVFEVTASRSTEFKGKDDSLLENVEITIFGKSGDRHDVLHTQSCQYGKGNGGVVCSGEVQLNLMSAQDFARTAGDPEAAKAVTTHVETRGVLFDRSSGVAQTDERVTFEFPSGRGEAQGLEYRSEQGTLVLRRNVHLRLIAQPRTASPKRKMPASSVPDPQTAQEVQISGTRLDFGRETRLLHLLGPAEADMSTKQLTAAEFTLLLDKDFRAEKLIASADKDKGVRPTASSDDADNHMRLDADTLTANFAPNGVVTGLDAEGSIHGTRANPAEQEAVSADSGTLEFWPALSQVKELKLKGSVVLKTQSSTSPASRTLQTSAFRMQFGGGKAGTLNRPETAETLAAGTMEWTDALQSPETVAKTKLRADKLQMDFIREGSPAVAGKPRQLIATGHVFTEREVPKGPLQTASARSGVAELMASGGWSQMELQGGVKLKEGDHLGEAEHALFVRATQTAVLTGHAIARDATTETHAPKITFSQANSDIFAEGGVRSTDLSARSASVQLAPAPANITADTLQANSKTGRALYTGKARLWQGDSVLEADSIELLRESRVLNAVGNVRAVFPQTSSGASGSSSQTTQAQVSEGAIAPVSTSQGITNPTLWHVSSEMLTYHDLESRAHLEKNVAVHSPEQRMHCPVLDLHFTRNEAPPSANTGSKSTGNPLVGAQQISRAVGSGGVIVEEEERKATAEHGEYLASAGKFVMSGGNPTLYDGAEGTTTGRQLTFFLADDTIIVDSENGSRTLTKHRVEK